MPDRVAVVGLLWFVVWTSLGVAGGSAIGGHAITGAITGFVLALVTCFAWPWIMPDLVQDWLYG